MPPVQHFRVRAKLHKILQAVGATETVFTKKQILSHLGAYIERKKLYDVKNMKIVRCKGDMLEDLFGVAEFTIDPTMWNFIFPHIVPATSKQVIQLENKTGTSESSNLDGKGMLESEIQWMSQLPWWYFVEKDKNAKSVVETVSGTAKNNSTIYVADTDYDSESCVLTSNRSSQDDCFSVEYEPDSDSDESDATEPVCESEDETTYSAPSLPLTDSGDSTATVTEDFWACTECPNMNPPIYSYCQRCWKMRKGWYGKSTAPAPVISKSQTLPPSDPSDDVPSLVRCFSQPPAIDVTDGKNGTNRCSAAGGSNFNSLPFNNMCKRKLDSSDNENSPSVKKIGLETGDHLKVDAPSTSSKHLEIEPVPASSACSKLGLPEMPGVCNICRSCPNDASFIHGNVGHQYCCYKCATRLQKSRKNCPVCRQPIELVVRNYIYQM